jgi:hypothetical protein
MLIKKRFSIRFGLRCYFEHFDGSFFLSSERLFSRLGVTRKCLLDCMCVGLFDCVEELGLSVTCSQFFSRALSTMVEPVDSEGALLFVTSAVYL